MWKKLVSLVILTLFVSGCAANQASFYSYPAGAEVFVNGQSIGTTPCQFDYHNDAGSSYEVVIQKDGFNALNQVVESDETDHKSQNTWLAAGLVWSPLWLGALFTKKLKDSYEFILKEEPADLTASQIAGNTSQRF